MVKYRQFYQNLLLTSISGVFIYYNDSNFKNLNNDYCHLKFSEDSEPWLEMSFSPSFCSLFTTKLVVSRNLSTQFTMQVCVFLSRLWLGVPIHTSQHCSVIEWSTWLNFCRCVSTWINLCICGSDAILSAIICIKISGTVTCKYFLPLKIFQ